MKERIEETVGEYTGILYGISSYSIYKNGHEIFHTGFRTINTREELINDLVNFDSFLELLGDKK